MFRVYRQICRCDQNRRVINSEHIRRYFRFWGKRNQNTSESGNSLKLSDRTSLAFYSLEPNYHKPSEESPIIIYHNLFTSKDMYQNVVKQLALKTGRTVYLLDMRNHGESVHSDAEHSDLNFMAKDVKDFMDEFKLNKAVLVGHGVGSLAMLRASLLFEDKVDKVVAFDVMPVDLPLFGFNLMDHMEFTVSSLPQDISLPFARLIVKQQLNPYFRDKTLLQFVLLNLKIDDKRFVKWRFNLPVIRQVLTKGIDRSPNYDKQYSGDVLIVSGKYGSITANMYSQLKEWFPKVKFDFYKNFRYILSPSKPKQFVNILVRSLSESKK